MSKWLVEKAERNRLSVARLTKALPAIFPPAVLSRALARPFVPPTPRLAIDSYWGAHPIRADRLARALAARTGPPNRWTWRLGNDRKNGLPATFRTPPAPYRERAYTRGPGFCCVCGQPVYRFGWHVDLWHTGVNRNAVWHGACVIAWQFWNAPSNNARLLRRLQASRCGQTGGRLWKNAEVDHRVPLFRVWRECRDVAWPALLHYWGLPNLQVINRDIHTVKCATEARDRRTASDFTSEFA
jgi:hypothetical protein